MKKRTPSGDRKALRLGCSSGRLSSHRGRPSLFRPTRISAPAGPDARPAGNDLTSLDAAEALDLLFPRVIRDSGPACLLVLQSDTADKDRAAKRTARDAKISVSPARDGVSIEPNHLYIAPPGSSLMLDQGTLRVMAEPSTQQSVHPSDARTTRRQEVKRALQQSEARLEAIFDTALDGIILINERGIIIGFNPAAERLFGYLAAEVLGQKVNLLMPPPDRDQHDSYLRRYLESGQKRILGIGREVSGRRKDGSIFPMNLAVSEVRSGNERVFAGIAHDLTDRKRWEEMQTTMNEQLETRVRTRTRSLRQANRRLQAEIAERQRLEEQARRHRVELAHVGRVHALGEMVSGLAHGLNQPLCAIVSNAQAAQRMLKRAPRRGELLNTLQDIADAGRHAGEIIQHLRDLLRKSDIKQTFLQINDVIREILRIIRPDADARGVAIRLKLADELPLIAGDRIQLQQVILNLVQNGMEAMSAKGAGERVLRIQTEEKPKNTLLVSVCDRGQGVPPEVAERLFEPFFTTKSGTGLGMGLSIGRSIVDAHGGRIRAASNPGCGATFQFELPAASSGGTR